MKEAESTPPIAEHASLSTQAYLLSVVTRTYPSYPALPTEKATFLGEEYSPPPIFDVPLPPAAPVIASDPPYERMTITQVVREGDQDVRRRRTSGKAIFGMVVTLSLIGVGIARCGEIIHAGTDRVVALQGGYDTMPTHDAEAPIQRDNPLLPDWQLPSVDPNAVTQDDTPSPSETAVGSPLSPVIPEDMKACVNKWSLERRVARLILPPVKADGSYALRTQATLASTRRLIRELHLGGVVITQGSAEQIDAVKKIYSAKGSFEAPLNIGDVQKDDWYGFKNQYLTTSMDMGAPPQTGGKQRPIAEVFGDELKNGTNVPVFLTDTFNAGKPPLTMYDQTLAMRDYGVQMVLRGQLPVDTLNTNVVKSFLAVNANPCAVKLG